MRIKEGFVCREVAGQTLVIATRKASKDFHGMIKLNETGKLIWQGVADGLTAEEIAQSLAEIYSVDEKKALSDVTDMIDKMEKAGFLCQ